MKNIYEEIKNLWKPCEIFWKFLKYKIEPWPFLWVEPRCAGKRRINKTHCSVGPAPTPDRPQKPLITALNGSSSCGNGLAPPTSHVPTLPQTCCPIIALFVLHFFKRASEIFHMRQRQWNFRFHLRGAEAKIEFTRTPFFVVALARAFCLQERPFVIVIISSCCCWRCCSYGCSRWCCCFVVFVSQWLHHRLLLQPQQPYLNKITRGQLNNWFPFPLALATLLHF